MPRALPFLIALPALFASATVWAACSDEVAELDQRLQKLEAKTEQTGAQGGGSDRTEVQVQKGNAEVEVQVEADEAGTEPAENWFGSAPSLENAREQIKAAQSLAADGDEDGCMGHVEQARAILDQLDD